MSDSDVRRRKENILHAHALVQGELLLLMMAASGGYDGVQDEAAVREQLVTDADAFVDAARRLHRTLLTGGDVAPE